MNPVRESGWILELNMPSACTSRDTTRAAYPTQLRTKDLWMHIPIRFLKSPLFSPITQIRSALVPNTIFDQHSGLISDQHPQSAVVTQTSDWNVDQMSVF
jgi:hypothetical protein